MPKTCICGKPVPKQNEKYCSKTCASIGLGQTINQIDEVMHDHTTPEEQERINQAFKDLQTQKLPRQTQ